MIEPPVAPTPDAIEAYPDYDVSETIERKLKAAPRQVADIILDYTQQCRTCKYPVASVIAQEVYQRDIDPYRFLVWQDVNKQINILVKKIPFKSSSWTQVRVFANADQSSIIIDSKLLDEQRAAQAAKQYARPSDPAFAILHSRWVITALVPDQHRGHQTLIKGVAGGKGQGVATLVPKPFMRKELKAVMSETLDFVEP